MEVSLHNLKSSGKRKRMRIGRGNSAGKGTYSGRGVKGQFARSGSSMRAGYEGGRTSLITSTPKMRGKGFRSFKAFVSVLNLGDLNRFNDGDVITQKKLVTARLVKPGPVKILGTGELRKKLSVRLPVSDSARVKIEKAGGTVMKPVDESGSKVEETEKSGV